MEFIRLKDDAWYYRLGVIKILCSISLETSVLNNCWYYLLLMNIYEYYAIDYYVTSLYIDIVIIMMLSKLQHYGD